MNEKYVKALEPFVEEDKEVDRYFVEQVRDMAKESGIFESEVQFATSRIDYFRKGFTDNYKQRIKTYKDIIDTFSDKDEIKVSEMFDDDVKTIKFLQTLGMGKDIIKSFRQYNKEKDNLKEVEAMSGDFGEDFGLDSNGMTEKEFEKVRFDAELKILQKRNDIAKKKFEVKEKYLEFRDALNKNENFKDFIEEINKDIKKYEKSKKEIDELADDAIAAIESEENVVEMIEELLKYEGVKA